MIATMISGRLREPAKWRLTEKIRTFTSATMIATDESNRAQIIALETLDDDIGRRLRKLRAGALVTVTGEATLSPMGRLKIRVRTVATLTTASEIEATPATFAPNDTSLITTLDQ